MQGGAPQLACGNRGSRRNRALVSLGHDPSLAVCAWGGLSASIFSFQGGADVSGVFTVNSHGISHSSFQTWVHPLHLIGEKSEDLAGK